MSPASHLSTVHIPWLTRIFAAQFTKAVRESQPARYTFSFRFEVFCANLGKQFQNCRNVGKISNRSSFENVIPGLDGMVLTPNDCRMVWSMSLDHVEDFFQTTFNTESPYYTMSQCSTMSFWLQCHSGWHQQDFCCRTQVSSVSSEASSRSLLLQLYRNGWFI